MLKLGNFRFVVLVCIFQCSSTQYSSKYFNPLETLELAFKERLISIDDLLAEKNKSPNDVIAPIVFPFHSEPDAYWNVRQMIENRGFNFEAHHVVTEDCYILEVHRIINPRDLTRNKRPVLLQHGLLDSSVGWMINSLGGHIDDEDDRNLSFALAKRGYDVWMGNYRGNTYSRNHTTFSTRDSDFWKFTFDNHALQDLPAQIAYIQNATDYDQIAYIGHSQGSLTMLNLLAMKPAVSKAIKPYIALAPVAHLGGILSPIKYFAYSPVLSRLLLYRNAELLPNSIFTRILGSVVCGAFPNLICGNLVFMLSGLSEKQLNFTRVSTYLAHLPAGTSLANIIHYGQNVRSRKAQLLDYMSTSTNLKCYNSRKPPLVPLQKINITDMYLLSAQNDLLADQKDIQLLKRQLRIRYKHKVVELKEFGHVEFMLSQNSDQYVTDYVLKVLEKKIPSMRVNADKRLRLKTFEENTCNSPKRNRPCHLNLKSALKNIY